MFDSFVSIFSTPFGPIFFYFRIYERQKRGEFLGVVQDGLFRAAIFSLNFFFLFFLNKYLFRLVKSH